MTAALFLILGTAASFLREGRRRAIDRLATTLIYTSFVVALVPLVAIIAQVLIKGLGVINAEFLTHSLRNIGPNEPAAASTTASSAPWSRRWSRA